MTDFWRDSGYHLLEPLENGRLGVTDDFLRAYFMRPEVRPVEESCAAERALHEALSRHPREPVSDTRLAALADPDARENYRVVLAFRDRLLAAGTLEDCYLGVFLEPGGVKVPPLFLDQLAHAIARGLLEGCADGLRARAAELLFREQRILLQEEGAVLAADAETVEMAAATGGFGSLGRLVAEAQTPLRSVELDVLREDNAELYWQRAQRYDTALQLNFATPGLDALCRVLESWVARFLDVAVSIQPVQRITDERWVWHVGLDAEGSRLLNDLYEGREVDEPRMERLLSLFRLDFAEPSVMIADLLVNLPLAERA
jgi:hypothetical protein